MGAPQPPTPQTPWDEAAGDKERMAAEGWGLFDRDCSGDIEVQYLQDKADNPLNEDYQAWELIWRRAGMRSDFHLNILRWLAENSQQEFLRILAWCAPGLALVPKAEPQSGTIRRPYPRA